MKLSKMALTTSVAALVMALSSCNHTDKTQESDGNHICPDPPITQIYIQPLNTYSASEAEAIGLKLAQVTEDVYMPVGTEILPTVQLSDEFKNESGTRYRADKILQWLQKGQKPVIALINDDISCSYKGIDDWGVLGLSYLGKDVCVVSTHRVKNPQDFWKVVYHEFGHAHYGLPHCPADDPTCIMRDAKGHPQLNPQKAICDSCWHSKK